MTNPSSMITPRIHKARVVNCFQFNKTIFYSFQLKLYVITSFT